MMYKIVHPLVDVDHNALITVNSSSVAINSFLKLYKPTSISSVWSSFLSTRCINVWNYLSEVELGNSRFESIRGSESKLIELRFTNLEKQPSSMSKVAQH